MVCIFALYFTVFHWKLHKQINLDILLLTLKGWNCTNWIVNTFQKRFLWWAYLQINAYHALQDQKSVTMSLMSEM